MLFYIRIFLILATFNWILEMAETDTQNLEIYTPIGCATCLNTGYQGRTGIYELFTIDDRLRTMIHDNAAENKIREHARKKGMQTIRQDGLRWVRGGATSLEEILRVTRE